MLYLSDLNVTRFESIASIENSAGISFLHLIGNTYVLMLRKKRINAQRLNPIYIFSQSKLKTRPRAFQMRREMSLIPRVADVFSIAFIR